MFTLFTIPKPFIDPHISLIQKNAIKSWTMLRPRCEIFLIGDDQGVAEAAREFNVGHLPDVKKNEFGTPLLDSAFALAQEAGKEPIMVYVNSDIILLNDFGGIFPYLPKNKFLALGQRWDLDMTGPISFSLGWGEMLKKEIAVRGKLHSEAGMDYFVFPKESFKNIPAFAVGRVGWDNWMIYGAKRERMPVVNITDVVTVIHQNHDYPAFNKGRERKENPEAQKNASLIPENFRGLTVKDSNYRLTKKGVKRNLLSIWQLLRRSAKRYLHL